MFLYYLLGLVNFCDPDGNSIGSLLGVFALPNVQIRVNVLDLKYFYQSFLYTLIQCLSN
jgi:hypothetical protein